MTATTDEKLNWLLEGLLDRTPGTRHALVLSRDGLKLCRTPELSVDQADQLAAISAGIQSLSHGASIEFGDGTGGVRSAMAEFYGGVLFIVEAGAGAHLAVVATGDAVAGGWWGEPRPVMWSDAVEAVRSVAASMGLDVTAAAFELAPWHPGRCAELSVDGEVVGHAGEVHDPEAIEGRTAPDPQE